MLHPGKARVAAVTTWIATTSPGVAIVGSPHHDVLHFNTTAAGAAALGLACHVKNTEPAGSVRVPCTWERGSVGAAVAQHIKHFEGTAVTAARPSRARRQQPGSACGPAPQPLPCPATSVNPMVSSIVSNFFGSGSTYNWPMFPPPAVFSFPRMLNFGFPTPSSSYLLVMPRCFGQTPQYLMPLNQAVADGNPLYWVNKTQNPCGGNQPISAFYVTATPVAGQPANSATVVTRRVPMAGANAFGDSVECKVRYCQIISFYVHFLL
jgi:hypothetical protein